MEYLALKEQEIREVQDRVASATQTATEEDSDTIKEELKQLSAKEVIEAH